MPANIKLKFPGNGEPGSLIVDGHDISTSVCEWPVTLEKVGEGRTGVYAIGVRLVGYAEIELPEAVLRLIEEPTE